MLHQIILALFVIAENVTTSVHEGLTAPVGLLCCNTQNNQHTDTVVVGATNRTEHEGEEERGKRKKADGRGREGREDRAAGRAPETQTWLYFVPVSTQNGILLNFPSIFDDKAVVGQTVGLKLHKNYIIII